MLIEAADEKIPGAAGAKTPGTEIVTLLTSTPIELELTAPDAEIVADPTHFIGELALTEPVALIEPVDG